MVMIIAHRGASMLSPENTISAIHSAIYLNCDMVEIDVRRCKTGELVLMHDKNVKRTTNGKGVVKQMPLEELKKLKVGKDGGIPTLDDALSYANGKIKVNIEIKELEFIDDAHHEGIKVNVYTVNDIPKIEEMKKLEVDGIITNHPELV